MASGGHLELRRETGTKDTHLGFDSIERVTKTICMDSMTQRERMK